MGPPTVNSLLIPFHWYPNILRVLFYLHLLLTTTSFTKQIKSFNLLDGCDFSYPLSKDSFYPIRPSSIKLSLHVSPFFHIKEISLSSPTSISIDLATIYLLAPLISHQSTFLPFENKIISILLTQIFYFPMSPTGEDPFHILPPFSLFTLP